MSDYTFAEKMFFLAAVFSGGLLVVKQLLNLSGLMEDRSTDIFLLALFIPLTIYVATRVSAVEERKQRKEYEERIEALLKQIAGNRRR